MRLWSTALAGATLSLSGCRPDGQSAREPVGSFRDVSDQAEPAEVTCPVGTAPSGRDAIVVVTSLEDGGPGSLRDAIEKHEAGASCERMPCSTTIVFEVAGTIVLTGRLMISAPNLTIAGQTAPTPGITLAGNTVHVQASNVALQHLRIRVGSCYAEPTSSCDSGGACQAGFVCRSGHCYPRCEAGECGGEGQHCSHCQSGRSVCDPAGEPENAESSVCTCRDLDGVTIGTDQHADPVRNVVVEHVTVSWAIDEGVGIASNASRVWVRSSLVVENLDVGHSKTTPHSCGLLVNAGAQAIRVTENVFAHNRSRNPWLGSDVTAVVANNLIYNPGSSAIQIHAWTGDVAPTRAVIAGNWLKPGPDTAWDPASIALPFHAKRKLRMPLVVVNDDLEKFVENPNKTLDGTRVFLADNEAFADGRWGPGEVFSEGVDVELVDAPEAWSDGCARSRASVLQSSGARPGERDELDKRILREIEEGAGRIIEHHGQVGAVAAIDGCVFRPLEAGCGVLIRDGNAPTSPCTVVEDAYPLPAETCCDSAWSAGEFEAWLERMSSEVGGTPRVAGAGGRIKQELSCLDYGGAALR
jgi:hypothetical protein